jgi:hypothetical protein
MVLAAPELVVAQRVEQLDQLQIALELQQRMLADGMVRGEERAKTEPLHAEISWWMRRWLYPPAWPGSKQPPLVRRNADRPGMQGRCPGSDAAERRWAVLVGCDAPRGMVTGQAGA